MSFVKVVEVNTEHGDRKQQKDRSSGAIAREAFEAQEFVVPGVPIVRSSTPRPLSFGLLEARRDRPQLAQQPGQENPSVFPVEAPSAPPLPEECGENAEDALHTMDMTPLPGHSTSTEDVANEFVWLFEYGLDMDVTILNNPARLNGLALLYGPAILRGYEITFDVLHAQTGQVVATIVPSRNLGAKVWGVLYRIPRRLTERHNSEPTLLDKVHSAVLPSGLFERLSVTVHETYRGREVSCITYVGSATARNQFHLLPRGRQVVDASYAERLMEIAKKQKLPEDYLHELAAIATPLKIEQPVTVGAGVEQNTEPLPVLSDEKQILASSRPIKKTACASRSIGLVIFALYMVVVLLTIFTLIILQGLGIGSNLLPANFTPLGIPWFVLVYGLIGGCLSCLVSIGRNYVGSPPPFVIISWFTRPFVGMILAALAYLLLNSGLFVLSADIEQHKTLFSLLAVLAGSCEGWLFYKRA